MYAHVYIYIYICIETVATHESAIAAIQHQ